MELIHTGESEPSLAESEMRNMRNETQNPNLLERISYAIFIALAFLIPIFFVPSQSVVFQFGKNLLVILSVIVLFSLWVFERFRDGRFAIPKSSILLAGFALPIVYLVSALFSKNISAGLIGQGFEFGTTISLALMFLLMFLASVFLRTKNRVFYLYLAFFSSFLVVVLYQGLRLLPFLGPSFLSFGTLIPTTASSIVGKWYDLAIFFGLGTVLSVVTLQFLTLGRVFRGMLYFIFFASLFFAIVINFYILWVFFALFGFSFFVYTVLFNRDGINIERGKSVHEYNQAVRGFIQSKNISLLPLVLLIVSLFFVIAELPSRSTQPVSDFISNVFKVQYVEVRPSWSGTAEIAKGTLSSSGRELILGAGPNQFISEWLRFKPAGVNNAIFWNTDFANGIGTIPSQLVTVGGLGFLAWILFLGLIFYKGAKLIFRPSEDPFTRYLTLSSFLGALYLWIMVIVYVPTMSIISLAFIFTGLFIAVLAQSHITEDKQVGFLRDPRLGFVSVLVMVLLILVSLSCAYFTLQRFVASVYYQRGQAIANMQYKDQNALMSGLNDSEALVRKANAFWTNDTYYTTISQINLAKLNIIASELSQPNVTKEQTATLVSQFGVIRDQMVGSAQLAIAYDPTNYQNYDLFGHVAEALIPIGVQQAYENAVLAYKKVIELNPHSPAAYLSLARVEIVHKDYTSAFGYIDKALAQKSNYTEAIILKTQLQIQQNDLKGAIDSVVQLAILNPNDPTVMFQLGFLLYNNKDWANSRVALERAVSLNTQYANARYFLGLDYANLDLRDQAIAQFVEIQKTNPDNQEVQSILTNLRSGKGAFTNVKPPLDNTPEKRKKPPIKESAAVSQN
jgi:tetratricopeptide (TPR) repeat protein